MGNGLKRYREFVEKTTDRLLTRYTNHLEQFSDTNIPTQKDFNDSVWGTIVVYPFELILLDSPLFQRLREIKQLGVGHWVYPSATHSRFEHTLGVLHQLNQLVASLNSHGDIYISEEKRRLLRVIAICHDVGHGAMSHVSDNAMQRQALVQDMLIRFSDEHDIEALKLSEVTSYYIVGSPAFRKLLKIGDRLVGQNRLSADTPEIVQKAIIGVHIDDQIPLLHELISGPFDADKLDYMARDARYAGVPTVTDINRLIQKVRAVKIPEAQLPEDIARNIKAGMGVYTLFGISLSGASTLDELMLGRALLFNKIYRHQKVRAAESMVALLIDLLFRYTKIPPENLVLQLVDSEILNIDWHRLEKLLGEEVDDKDSVAIAIVDISTRLRERRLFTRSFAFCSVMPSDPFWSDESQKEAQRNISIDIGDPEKVTDLVEQISDEAEKILNLLKKGNILNQYPNKKLAYHISIGGQEIEHDDSDTPRAYLIDNEQKPLKFRMRRGGAKGWTDAYLLTRDLAYVFAPRTISDYVNIATEKVLHRAYGLRVPRSMYQYSKCEWGKIQAIKSELAQVDYYKLEDYHLRPFPERLAMADIPRKLLKISNNLSGYNGPNLTNGELVQSVISPERIESWLRQFDDDLIEEALAILKRIKIVGRQEMTAAYVQFMEQNPDFSDANVVQFGSPKDSSAIQTYYIDDIATDYGHTICDLDEALKNDNPIIFVDDFIASGGQSRTILEGWLDGLGAVTTTLGENRLKKLDNDQKEKFCCKKLGFVFLAGWEDGIKELKHAAKELQLNVTTYVGLVDSDLPSIYSSQMNIEKERELPIIKRFNEIGTQLIKEYSPDRGSEERAERYLGYGNRGMLIVFPYNTPAQTLTCLWCNGTVDGLRWEALFPRRKKTPQYTDHMLQVSD